MPRSVLQEPRDSFLQEAVLEQELLYFFIFYLFLPTSDGFAKTSEEAVPFSACMLCVRGLSLRVIYCEIRSSL